MSSLFSYPSINSMRASAIMARTVSEQGVGDTGFFATLLNANTFSTSLEDILQERLGVMPYTGSLNTDEELAAYTQNLVGSMHIAIDPEVMQSMKDNPTLRDNLLSQLEEHIGQKSEATRQHLEDIGYKASAMGYIVRADGSIATWVSGDEAPKSMSVAPVNSMSEAGEESQAMRLARKRVERQETIKDFSLRQIISTIQVERAMEAKQVLQNLLFV